jgi:hypothetical protein
MSKNAQKHTPRNTTKGNNRACMLIRPFELRPQAPALPDPTPATHPTKFGCIAYITGFGFDYRAHKFVPVIRKSEAVPAWKAPTLRSSHVL